jgi:hypothetical protein
VFETVTKGSDTTTSGSPPEKGARIRRAYQELLRLKRAKELIDVVMGLDTFTDMVITSFVIDRAVENGADLPFSMEFKRVKIVKSEPTAINASSTTAPKTAASDQISETANEGTAVTEKPEENQTKEEWRRRVQMEGANRNILADYKRRWNTDYPQ